MAVVVDFHAAQVTGKLCRTNFTFAAPLVRLLPVLPGELDPALEYR